MTCYSALREEAITIHGLPTDLFVVLDPRAECLRGEIGRYDGFCIVVSSSYAPPSKPKQITYGPQRKGRGGKVRRW